TAAIALTPVVLTFLGVLPAGVPAEPWQESGVLLARCPLAPGETDVADVDGDQQRIEARPGGRPSEVGSGWEAHRMGGGRWRRWQETAPPPGRAAEAARVRRCSGEGTGRTRSMSSKKYGQEGTTLPSAGAAEPVLEPRRADARVGSVGGEA